MIPEISPMAPDENFASWIDYIARINGAESRKEKEKFFYAVTGDKSYLSRNKPGRQDYFESLGALCMAERDSPAFPGIAEVLEKHTDLYALLPFMDKGMQAKRMEYCLHQRGDGQYLGGTKHLSSPKICPVCLKEDMEKYHRLVVHVRHSLGVNACARHGCMLLDASVLEGSALEEGKMPEAVPAPKQEIKKAEFMDGLYDSPVIAYYRLTRDAFLEVAKKKGLTEEKACRKAADAGYAMQGTLKLFSRRNRSDSRNDSLRNAIGVLTWFFGTAENFRKSLPKWDPAQEYDGRDFRILSCRGILAEYKCKKCGNTFYMHPDAAAYGIPCPYCRQKMTDVEICRREAECLDDGEFDISHDENGKLKIIHKACGTDRTGTFNSSVWAHRKCRACQMKEVEKKYIGLEKENMQGRRMKIISFDRGSKVGIRFDNGETVTRRFEQFQKGDVAMPSDKRLEEKYVGKEGENNQGVGMKIIRYKNVHDISVQFEDGSVAEHRNYSHFENGSIQCPDFSKKRRLGMEKENYQGIMMKITEYGSAKDMTVEFETGDIVEHAAFDRFKDGRVKCPSTNIKKPSRQGEFGISRTGHWMMIKKYNSSNDMDVLFDNGYVARGVSYYNFKIGKVRCGDPSENDE